MGHGSCDTNGAQARGQHRILDRVEGIAKAVGGVLAEAVVGSACSRRDGGRWDPTIAAPAPWPGPGPAPAPAAEPPAMPELIAEKTSLREPGMAVPSGSTVDSATESAAGRGDVLRGLGDVSRNEIVWKTRP